MRRSTSPLYFCKLGQRMLAYLSLWRKLHVSIRIYNSAGKLAENHRCFWHRQVLLGAMVSVVHPNTNDFLWTGDWRANLYTAAWHNVLSTGHSTEREREKWKWDQRKGHHIVSHNTCSITLEYYIVVQAVVVMSAVRVSPPPPLPPSSNMILTHHTYYRCARAWTPHRPAIPTHSWFAPDSDVQISNSGGTLWWDVWKTLDNV